ncbi:uncharacterized protein LOC100203416 isoform X1 [Hydra vulgaris]|uniref:uncharacterized protein LOC100203416 isoform X1 n=1 Tax=Hydra vulgaris TaxID=6087 RepID=UPI0002B44F0D|nr:uncharacterized protein LOC100203416 [Hydra vulgaris]XP_047136014.1 uncharacterized protein LOC100203416 [Hydra vulgaris]
MIAGELKKLLSIKIKYRSDGFTDQFNRVLVMKLLLVCSTVMCINWFKDSVNCVVPSSATVSSSFVSSACWIQGVYVYDELKERVDSVGYYGIPKDIDMDGTYEDGRPCPVKTDSKVFIGCKPLTKTFFLQYQWFPFYIGAMALCFYLPYVLHLFANEDLISLKKTVKSNGSSADAILNSYFNRKTSSKSRLRLRILYNYIIKSLYVFVNIISFILTDKIFLGKFKNYGSKWLLWSKLPNSVAYDYMGARSFPKPGNELLPPFGYCELYESSKDIKHSVANHYRFLCEMSQNILYQYCLIVVWFLLVLGIVISIIGLLVLLLNHVLTIVFVVFRGLSARKLYKVLSLRECEYLELIRKRNLPLYSEIILKLRLEKYNGTGSTPCESPPPGFDDLSKLNSHV